MKSITETQFDSLVQGIYEMLMGITMYAESGEKVEFGMGEMGECRDTATATVKEWMEKENIEIGEDDEDEPTAFGFNLEDVKQHALDELDLQLTDEQAKEIQGIMLKDGDVGQGVSWATVLQAIETFVERTDKKDLTYIEDIKF